MAAITAASLSPPNCLLIASFGLHVHRRSEGSVTISGVAKGGRKQQEINESGKR